MGNQSVTWYQPLGRKFLIEGKLKRIVINYLCRVEMSAFNKLGTIALALLGAGLFYVLSIGPMALAADRDWIPEEVGIIYEPLNVFVGTPLEPAIYRYMVWWAGEKTGP